ncbi:MAG: iron ABC transporter permease [Erysipelotrichaceae bacterium]|nr:iron ABC transporter permease [Erysipelotrichaceae bacterium]
MNKNRTIVWLIAGVLVACFLIAICSLCFGTVNVSITQLWEILFQGERTVSANIILYARAPRTLACLFAGAALSLSGAILQNVLSNKLASPSIIGVNAGAGLGVTICCAFGILAGIKVSLAAFVGSLLAVSVLSLFASRTNASKTTVILGGVAFNSILNAFSESIVALQPAIAALNADFRIGGFASISYARLLPAMGMIALAVLILFTLFNELDVVALGDETAQSVGLRVKRYRVLFLILAALLAGSAVSFSGLLGFVGLIVPHFVRRLVGNEARYLLPLCACVGAGFVCLCDLIARLIFQPYELPVGILMALIGGPVFAMLLIRYKGGHRHA